MTWEEQRGRKKKMESYEKMRRKVEIGREGTMGRQVRSIVLNCFHLFLKESKILVTMKHLSSVYI